MTGAKDYQVSKQQIILLVFLHTMRAKSHRISQSISLCLASGRQIGQLISSPDVLRLLSVSY